MKLNFSGNNALILGGSCELAIYLAEFMIKASLFPILTYRNEKGKRHISERLESSKVKYRSFYLSLGDRDSLDFMLDKIGHDIDYLVDFAQGDFESYVASADEDTIRRYFDENVSFRAEILKKVSRLMLKKKKGRLIFVSSTAADMPNPGQGFYAAAKLASEALYRNLGLELGDRGVTAVSLRPGYIDAGRGREYIKTRGEEVLRTVPIKRALTGAEVAGTILFLLSDSAAGFNATEISLDGGLTAGK
jgi:3-oxoacyl-[acyl-carrier protein] reductase